MLYKEIDRFYTLFNKTLAADAAFITYDNRFTLIALLKKLGYYPGIYAG